MKKLLAVLLFILPSLASADVAFNFDAEGNNQTFANVYDGSSFTGAYDIVFHATTSLYIDYFDILHGNFNADPNSTLHPVDETPFLMMKLYTGTATSGLAYRDIAFTDSGTDVGDIPLTWADDCVGGLYDFDYCRIRFQFVSPTRLTAGETYTFRIEPLVSGDPINFKWRVNSGGVNQYLTAVRFLESFDEDDPIFSTWDSRIEIGLVGGTGDAVITLAEPCVTDSNSATYCQAGTDTLGSYFIPVKGTATPNMTYMDGYDVFIMLTQNDWPIDTQRIYGGFDSAIDFDTVVHFATSSTQMARLSVCMVPTGSWDPTDAYMCADAMIGYDLTTASTTALVEELDLVRDLPWTERGIAGPDTPVDQVLDDVGSFLKSKFDYLLTLWPWGYIKLTYDEYTAQAAAYNASSTAFAMTLKPEDFNLPAADSPVVFDLGAMAASAATMSPELFTSIDIILWGLFALFLVFRIARGTWEHGLEYGSSVAKREWNDAWKTGGGSIKMASYLTGNYRKR